MAVNTDEALSHHGVLGMHWGHHNAKSKEDLVNKAKAHELSSSQHAHLAVQYQQEHAELQEHGTRSAAFKRVYGDHAADMTDREFYGRNGQSKAQALQQTDNNLRLVANYHARAANKHSAKAKKLREKAAGMEHGDLVNEQVVDEFLAHHGVLGMKWGHHLAGGKASGPSTATKGSVWKAGKSYKPEHQAIIDARHRQIAVRKEYNDARKSGDTKAAAAAKAKFNTSQDRVTADHLTSGEKVVSVVLGNGGTGGALAGLRTNRSVQLSKKGDVARTLALANLSNAPGGAIAGTRVERGAIQKRVNRAAANK